MNDIYKGDKVFPFRKEQVDAIADSKYNSSAGQVYPIFSLENKPYLQNNVLHTGTRKYQVLSWKQIYDKCYCPDIRERCWYEVVPPDSPCNLYIDYDAPQIGSVDPAIAEMNKRLEQAKNQLHARNVEGMDFDWSEVKVNILCGDVEGKKESRHHLFHFPGDRMFANNIQCKNFIELAVKLSVDDLGYEYNPLFRKEVNRRMGAEKTEYTCIADRTVYTKYRCFRMTHQVKAKQFQADFRGWLIPVCDHAESDGCSCKVKAPEELFYANCITYIPPDVTPDLLSVPAQDVPLPSNIVADAIQVFPMRKDMVTAIRDAHGGSTYEITYGVFSFENEPYVDPKTDKVTFGSRKYQAKTWEQIYQAASVADKYARRWHEVVLKDKPCHLYVDIDLHSNDSGRSADAAIQELLLRLREANALVPQWGYNWDDVTLTTFTADTDEKQSRHLIFHLPNKEMFRNAHHCRLFLQLAIQLSINQLGKEKSPLILAHTRNSVDNDEDIVEYSSIIDLSVYSDNHTFRMPYQVKARQSLSEYKGWLLPTSGDGEITRESFFAGCVTYSEWPAVRTPSTFPEVGMVFDDIIRSDRKRTHIAENLPWSGDSNDNVDRDELFEKLAAHIVKMLDNHFKGNTHTRYRTVDNTIYVKTTGKFCVHKNDSHRNSFVHYVVSLNYPLPRIRIECFNDKCKPKREANPKYVELAADEEYERLVMQYFDANIVTGNILFLPTTPFKKLLLEKQL